ncbi:hypothetical protein [Dactylosporangium sp. NPDC000521]|uniref:hypothetical protein n=1 Tax=Dactylosporangium sp. NPDC000521 TaxID=3363975 RepID=UPI0036CEA07A
MSSNGPAAVLEAAELCSAAGDHADAAHLLAEALITGPSDPDLLRALAGAQFAIGWDGCALALLAEAHRVAPDDEAVITDRNIALRDHGRFVEALAVLGASPQRTLRAGTYDDMGLPVLAVEAEATGRRGLWWRTGGPLPFLRARRRRVEERILADLVEAAGPPSPAPVDLAALLTRIVNGTAQDRAALAASRAATRLAAGGNLADGAAVLAGALRRDTTHPLLLRLAAQIADSLDRHGAALALYRRLAVDPSPIGILAQQGHLLTRMQRPAEAMRFVAGLPAGTARAGELRRVVATACADAGLAASAVDAHDRPGIVADWHRPLWWRTGGPLPALRWRSRLRDNEAMRGWTPLPVGELIGPLATVDAADLMDAAARAAAVLAQARQAEERGGTAAAIDILATAAVATPDPQIIKELAGKLSADDRDEEALGWLDRAVAADPADVELVAARLTTLTWLDRTREARDLVDALPAATRATELVRERESWLNERQRLWTPALDALGPAATVPSWLRGRHRRLWWRTGGPLWVLRRRTRSADLGALESWRSGTLPLLSTLDGVVAAATPAMRAVVDGNRLDHEVLTMLWERANVVARLTAGYLATAAAAVVLARIAATATGLPAGWALFAGATAAGLDYLALRRWLFRYTRADSGRLAVTRAAPLIVALAVAGAALYRLGGWTALAGGTLAALAGTATARLAAAAVCRIPAARAMRRHLRSEPRAAALSETLAMLGELRQHGRRNDLFWRQFWLWRLERIAQALERDLPVSFGLVDPDTHRQLTDGGRAAARAVRQLKFLVAAPASADSWRRVEDALRHNAGALATGELGRLRRVAAVAAPAPVRRGRRAVAAEIARTAVFAGLPLAAVYLAQPWLDFSETFHDWAKVVGLGWALLYVLLTLDPTLHAKLSTALSMVTLGQTGDPAAVARSRDSARSAAP